MASKNTIQHRLALDNGDFNSKVEESAKVAKDSFAGIHESIDKAGAKAGNSGELLEKLKDKLLGVKEAGKEGGGREEKGSESAVQKVKGGLNEALTSVAEGAELNIGSKLATLAIAARAGIVGFVGTISGMLIGALEKAGDEINDRIARLWSFTGSLDKGKEANEQLTKVADDLKVPVSTLAPAFEQLQRTNSVLQPKDQLDGAGLQDVVRSFINGANADRVPNEKATDAFGKFVADLRENGRLTKDNAKQLGDVMPKFTDRLIDRLQEKFGKDTYYSAAQTLGAARELHPQLAEDAAATQAQFPSSIGDAYTTLKASTEKLAEEISGGHAIAGTLEATAKVIDGVADGIKHLKDASDKLGNDKPVSPERANELRDARATAGQAAVGPVQGPQQYDFLRRPPSTEAPEETPAGIRFFQSIAQAFGLDGKPGAYTPEGKDASQSGVGGIGSDAVAAKSEEARASTDAAKQVEKLGEAAGGSSEKLEKLYPFEKQLPAYGAHLSTEQARIDAKYTPEETGIKLGRDELAVDSAKLQREQLEIAKKDAAKSQDLARLAPEQARENVASAESRFNKAWHARNVAHGLGDNFDPVRQQMDDADNEYDAAQTALKRARIERKYAYLEEPKAALGAKKVEQDIRSQQYLEQSAKLTYAKDSEGATLAPEVANLRYAQAQLEEIKAMAKIGDEQLATLKDILAALSKGGKGGEKTGEASDSDTGKASDRDDSGGSGSGSGSRSDNRSGSADDRSASGDDKRSKLLGPDDVINIPHGASQDEINKAQRQQRAARGGDDVSPVTKEGFRAAQDQSIEELKEDWASQRQLNENIARQNGGYQSAKERYPYSPGGRNPNYTRGTHGHYDPRTQDFIPEEPTYSDGTPKSDDYDFAGRKNPAGKYTEGISSPLTFPRYNEQQYRDRPSEYPDGVPLPQPRPAEADQQVPLPQPRPPGADQQSAPPDNTQTTDLSGAIRELISTLATKATNEPPSSSPAAPADGPGSGGDGASEGIAKLGSSTEEASGAVSDLTSAFSEAANSIRSKKSDDDDTQHAAEGGHITGPGTSTSDSIPAMLSHGEYVVHAGAVKHYGTSFMNKLNKMGFAKGGLIEVPHFAVGGPVTVSSGPAPRVKADLGDANGGAAGHYSVDLRTNHGDFRMLAPEHVARSMSAAARDSSNAQTGQRPSWYKGR